MRERKTGCVIWIGSIGGWVGGGYGGLYSSTKWAMKGISRSLHQEISPLGLRSICVDFGYFRTTVLSDGQRAPPIARVSAYQPLIDSVERHMKRADGKQPGDPKKGVQVIVDLLHKEGKFAGKADSELPTSLALGSDAYKIIKGSLDEDAANLEQWKEVTESTDFHE
ncbi:hypothetical protein NMY22_g4366 [Coprinellus aureogranulatus]|nr:hypothetical protein NMY22_g4366 [Coprinellus aureogranulatus]